MGSRQKQSQVQSQIAELRMKEDALAAQLRSIATDPQDLTSRASAFLDGGIEAINHREHLAEQPEMTKGSVSSIEPARFSCSVVSQVSSCSRVSMKF